MYFKYLLNKDENKYLGNYFSVEYATRFKGDQYELLNNIYKCSKNRKIFNKNKKLFISYYSILVLSSLAMYALGLASLFSINNLIIIMVILGIGILQTFTLYFRYSMVWLNVEHSLFNSLFVQGNFMQGSPLPNIFSLNWYYLYLFAEDEDIDSKHLYLCNIIRSRIKRKKDNKFDKTDKLNAPIKYLVNRVRIKFKNPKQYIVDENIAKKNYSLEEFDKKIKWPIKVYIAYMILVISLFLIYFVTTIVCLVTRTGEYYV